MELTPVVQIVLALIGLVGTVLTIYIPIRMNDSAAIRKELGERCKLLEASIAKIQTELDQWKIKYFEMIDERSKINNELRAALIQLDDIKRYIPEDIKRRYERSKKSING